MNTDKTTPPKISEDEVEKLGHALWKNLPQFSCGLNKIDAKIIARWHLEQTAQLKSENALLKEEQIRGVDYAARVTEIKALRLSLAQKDEALCESKDLIMAAKTMMKYRYILHDNQWLNLQNATNRLDAKLQSVGLSTS